MAGFRLPLWALAWLAVLLGILVIFLANKPAVDRLFDAVGLTAMLYPEGRDGVPNIVQAPQPNPKAQIVLEGGPLASIQPLPSPIADEELSNLNPNPSSDVAVNSPSAPLFSPVATSGVGSNHYQLYFLKLGPDDRLGPAAFGRELPAGSTPLSATIKALLQGPSLQEQEQGALSLIAEGTKLLSVRLQGRIAILNFSNDFQRNPLGNEGFAGQLKQIVWTATQFASVDSVQILIDGQTVSNLGEEGLSIAAPLTRTSIH